MVSAIFIFKLLLKITSDQWKWKIHLKGKWNTIGKNIKYQRLKKIHHPIRFKGLPKYRSKHWRKKCQGTQFGQATCTVQKAFQSFNSIKDVSDFCTVTKHFRASIVSKMFLIFCSSF